MCATKHIVFAICESVFCQLGNLIDFIYPVLCLVAQSAWLLWPKDCSPPGSSVRVDSPGKNTRVGCHALLQGIFPVQGSNPRLPHRRWILYHLSHQGSPRILQWVVCPFSRGSSWPRNWARPPALQADSLATELSGKPSKYCSMWYRIYYIL